MRIRDYLKPKYHGVSETVSDLISVALLVSTAGFFTLESIVRQHGSLKQFGLESHRRIVSQIDSYEHGFELKEMGILWPRFEMFSSNKKKVGSISISTERRSRGSQMTRYSFEIRELGSGYELVQQRPDSLEHFLLQKGIPVMRIDECDAKPSEGQGPYTPRKYCIREYSQGKPSATPKFVIEEHYLAAIERETAVQRFGTKRIFKQWEIKDLYVQKYGPRIFVVRDAAGKDVGSIMTRYAEDPMQVKDVKKREHIRYMQQKQYYHVGFKDHSVLLPLLMSVPVINFDFDTNFQYSRNPKKTR